MDSTDEYKKLFENAGYYVRFCELEVMSSQYSLEEAVRIFKSGAAIAYLSPKYYNAPLTSKYEKDFYDIVEHSLRYQAETSGKISLLFNRIYLVAEKI